ncbi:MAG: hypothetical protein Q8K82_20170 [Gemmatimonadaceae bacterium]|nr:hypothetical protein [Gemmatimonadaceae bacterium]
MQKMRVIAFATIAMLFVSYADARPTRLVDAGLRASPVCVTDSPFFVARAHWRWVRSATLEDVISLRSNLGLADVPIDSITYERDEVKCARVVAALNAFRSPPDTVNRMREVTLVSWGGIRYIAKLSGDDWAVFDSTQTFLRLLTTP